MEQVKQKQKEAYDARHRELSFQAGDLVLVYKPFRKVGKSEKLLRRWLGPYKVLRQTTPVNYGVISATGRGKADIVHVARMKSFHEATLDWQSPQTAISDNTESTAENVQQPEMREEINVSPDTTDNEVPSSPPDQISSNASRRPMRNRRPPASTSLILRENAIFKQQADVAFSESSWTIVTDLDFGPVDAATAYLKEKILQQQEVAERWKNQGSRPQQIAAKRITSRMQSFLKGMENALNNQIQNLSQNQREIIHIVDKQATVLNELLWETRTNAKNATINIMEKITDMEDLELSHFEYFFQLDETFEAMNQILQWLQQLADSLDVGFSLLANGHLAPQIISPAKFNKVIKTINVAAMENSFRLFIHVPIFDHAQQYKLFQIINLPGATDNGTHGVLFGNLPDYLAVSANLETFLELSKDDFQDCSKIGRPLCKFHTGISKRTARKYCAIAVFLNDTPRINTQCKKKFTEWRGPEVIYLGKKPMGLFSNKAA
ncbi:hypothetical protein GHT06_022545 [Daphnia sinensis]|uniref:Integrase p58-like C-terminal domain-containing protein n=1 Tax=Daphnia sinensis TaxID=1820382 RepID=A0AAD5KXC9_9CRUS|nr:hypothetical protein GHT06_022545 [Daphnia sinensis]